MKDESQIQNKAVQPVDDKGVVSKVWIRVNEDRVIMGIGKAGDEILVSELVAKNFVAQGLATIIEKENTNG